MIARRPRRGKNMVKKTKTEAGVKKIEERDKLHV
jgi:hypothetical protein